MNTLEQATPNRRRWWALGGVVALIVAAGVLVACGGGSGPTSSSEQAAAPDKQAQAVSPTWNPRVPGPDVTWAPASITDTANPGSKVTFPVTFTPAVALANLTVTVVPALAGVVSVSPAWYASVPKGQATTLNVTISPGASQALGTLNGTIRLTVSTSTEAKPLAVTIGIVKPELINGLVVPPEPPADLNNLTIAGFDSNRNGVRDDVERRIAAESNSLGEDLNALAIARAYQSILTTVSISQSQYDIAFQSIVCANDKATALLNSSQIRFYVVNLDFRKNYYRQNIAGISGQIYPLEDCPKQ